MLLEKYLALLSWQNCKIHAQDFINLKNQDIQNPEQLLHCVTSPHTKEYLMANKMWWKKAVTDYHYCKSKDYQLLYPGHPEYPKSFLQCFNIAPILLVLGDLSSQRCFTPVTFVGSRLADQTALSWMDFYLSSLIREKNICIVSGGAKGIDQKAHSLAIRACTPSVCFLPSGLDHFYPKNLYELKKSFLDCGGVFISCFSPWTEVQKFHFQFRNRLMSAYSLLVVVIQSQLRSGTILTAKKALDLGVPLAVLPGPTLSSKWAGNLQLIYDGAPMVRDATDLSLLMDSLIISSQQKSPNPLMYSGFEF